MGPSGTFPTLFSYRILVCQDKNSLYILPDVLTTISQKSPLFLFRAIFLTDLDRHGSPKALCQAPHCATIAGQMPLQRGLLRVAIGRRRQLARRTRLRKLQEPRLRKEGKPSPWSREGRYPSTFIWSSLPIRNWSPKSIWNSYCLEYISHSWSYFVGRAKHHSSEHQP